MIQYPPDWVVQEAMAIMPGITMDHVMSPERGAPNCVGREVLVGCLCEFCATTPYEAAKMLGIGSSSAYKSTHRFAIHPGRDWTLERVRARLLKRMNEGKDPPVPAECRRAG